MDNILTVSNILVCAAGQQAMWKAPPGLQLVHHESLGPVHRGHSFGLLTGSPSRPLDRSPHEGSLGQKYFVGDRVEGSHCNTFESLCSARGASKSGSAQVVRWSIRNVLLVKALVLSQHVRTRVET